MRLGGGFLIIAAQNQNKFGSGIKLFYGLYYKTPAPYRTSKASSGTGQKHPSLPAGRKIASRRSGINFKTIFSYSFFAPFSAFT